MTSVALDDRDRRMAALVWAGFAGCGPLLPLALLVVNWSRADSLARRHAIVACLIWLALLAIWLPVLIAQLILTTEDPPLWVFALAAALPLAGLLCSIVGAVLAFRAPLVKR